MVKIVVDSTADLPEHLRAASDIHVVPLSVIFGSEVLLDGIDFTKDQFYARLQQGAARHEPMPTTSAPSIGAFVEVYERLAQETDTILSIHLSSKMSSTVQVARQAAAMVPHVRVEVVDSLHMTLVLSFMALAAARAARAGTGLDELVPLVQDVGARAFTFIGLESLQHLERGGRIGHARALLGRLLSVKPIVEIRDGEVHPLEQVRTTKRMLARMIELTRAQGDIEELAVLYAANSEHVQRVYDTIAEADLVPAEQLMFVQVGGVIGTHVGPDSVGIAGVRRGA